jgi:Flp pilus assembly protein TadB
MRTNHLYRLLIGLLSATLVAVSTAYVQEKHARQEAELARCRAEAARNEAEAKAERHKSLEMFVRHAASNINRGQARRIEELTAENDYLRTNLRAKGGALSAPFPLRARETPAPLER